ncbi:hypothetical protein OH687_13555 [Burkholderia anthina]|nr:hypothetical protein OH687_13555 [Burkholderia anthina]
MSTAAGRAHASVRGAAFADERTRCDTLKEANNVPLAQEARSCWLPAMHVARRGRKRGGFVSSLIRRV